MQKNDGNWFLGGEFADQLSEEQLRELILNHR